MELERYFAWSLQLVPYKNLIELAQKEVKGIVFNIFCSYLM